jgi:hypothetical protein
MEFVRFSCYFLNCQNFPFPNSQNFLFQTVKIFLFQTVKISLFKLSKFPFSKLSKFSFSKCQNFPFQTVKISFSKLSKFLFSKLSKFPFSNCQNFLFQTVRISFFKLSEFPFPNCQNFPFPNCQNLKKTVKILDNLLSKKIDHLIPASPNKIQTVTFQQIPEINFPTRTLNHKSSLQYIHRKILMYVLFHPFLKSQQRSERHLCIHKEHCLRRVYIKTTS